MHKRDYPIGVIDSGVGGLTVVKELQDLLPHEDILYFGDTKHCPYGNRSKEEIAGLAEKIIAFLEEKQVKLLAIACNTLSIVLDHVEKSFDVEIIGIVASAAQYVVRIHPKRVGILATVYTAASHEYDQLIHAQAPEITVTSQGSPVLASLIEQGNIDADAIDAAIKKEMNDLLAQAPQTTTIVLGCTHYPIVLDRFQALFPKITFINPAKKQARAVADLLEERSLATTRTQPGTFTLYTSGERGMYPKIIKKIGVVPPDHYYEKQQL